MAKARNVQKKKSHKILLANHIFSMEISIYLPLNSNNKRKKKRGRKEEVKVRSDRRGKEITCPGSSLDPGDRAAPAQLNFPHPEVTFFFFVQMSEHVQSALLDLCGHGLRGFGGLLVFLVPWSCLLPKPGLFCAVNQKRRVSPRKVQPYLHTSPIPATSCSNLPT